MSELERILSANESYSKGLGDRAGQAAPPARRVALLTCMDARLHPEKFAGFDEGDAHVIRNAGGRASEDAIRSLIISSRLLGTREFYVIHHTDCGGMASDEQLRDKLRRATGSELVDRVDWLGFTDLEASVVEDVRRIREHPLIAGDIAIYGMVYDVASGRLREVKAASEAGRPTVEA